MPKAYEDTPEEQHSTSHDTSHDARPARVRAVRDNRRHQWEKDRARQPLDERASTGATEHETGLASGELVFHAEYDEIPAPQDLAETFAVPTGTPLLRRSYRTRCVSEPAPLSLVTSYLPRDMIAANPALLDASREPWPGGTHHQLRTVGIEIDRVEERVTARPATGREATELRLPDGACVMLLRKTSYDIHGRVVDLADVVLPADRTELLFTTRLERW
ncbi:UTRA domain-containing protein [Streptomyces sp. enrichment culture]|uniref:UTRA domain-containing protein n=1 Tax=Streptomyces sp. enrichment culture TaxID=1795815 RepID=UPI003F56904A